MEVETKKNYCREILSQELSQRKTKNPLYSLRAFARDLNIGSTSLSDVLADKRKLSRKNIMKVTEKLALSPQQLDLLLSELRGKEEKSSEEVEYLQVQEDTFRLIADWYYLAILNLCKLSDNEGNPEWISKRIGIEVEQAKQALDRLQRMGFLIIREGKIYRTSLPINTSRDIPSQAVRKHHSDNLHLAEKALDSVPVGMREFSSMTMAIDPTKLPQAKELLMKTKQKIAQILETDDPEEVYVLSFQLFPLTKEDAK